MANALFKLFGEIAVETGTVEKDLGTVKKSAEKTGEAIAGNKRTSLAERMNKFGATSKKVGSGLTKGFTAPILGIGTALLAGTTKLGNMADEILDLAAVTNMSTDALQEWRHVADIAGVSQNTVADSARRMSERLEGLGEQTDENAALFNQLGISQNAWLNSTQDDRMTQVIASLADMEDGMERNRLAQEFFGKGWQDMAPILDMTSDEIAELNLQAHELNKVIGEEGLNEANEFRIEMGLLKDEFMAAGREMLMNFLPALRDNILPLIREQVIPFVTRLAEGLGKLAEWFSGLSPLMQKVVIGLIGIATAAGPVLSFVGSLTTALTALTAVSWAAMLPWIKWIAIIGVAVAAIYGLYKGLKVLWDILEFVFLKKIEVVSSIFVATIDTLVSLITGRWEMIKNVFTAGIDFIRGLFNFEFRWPSIPMPKFGINPDGWQMGDLLKGSIPRLDVSWNAEGGIFTKPTIFNTANAGLQGVGEAGPEAILPLNDGSFSAIGNGISANMKRDNANLERLLAEQIKVTQQLGEEISKMKIQMDGRTVGDIVTSRVNENLGKEQRKNNNRYR